MLVKILVKNPILGLVFFENLYYYVYIFNNSCRFLQIKRRITKWLIKLLILASAVVLAHLNVQQALSLKEMLITKSMQLPALTVVLVQQLAQQALSKLNNEQATLNCLTGWLNLTGSFFIFLFIF